MDRGECRLEAKEAALEAKVKIMTAKKINPAYVPKVRSVSHLWPETSLFPCYSMDHDSSI